MLDRLSVTFAIAAISAIVGKLLTLYDAHRLDWLNGLIAVYLAILRIKMMHDDHNYFSFLKTSQDKKLLRLELLFCYCSWMLWGPAIYFMDKTNVFAEWMLSSLLVAALWLIVDLCTKKYDTKKPGDINKTGDTERDKRFYFLTFNVIYCVILGILIFADHDLGVILAAGLVLAVLLDWLINDPFKDLIID